MRKLRLAIDDLDVQSFATDNLGVGRGTIRGNDVTPWCNSEFALCTQMESCFGGHTCDLYSCPAESCDGCGTTMCGTDQTACWDFSCIDSCATCNPTACITEQSCPDTACCP